MAHGQCPQATLFIDCFFCLVFLKRGGCFVWGHQQPNWDCQFVVFCPWVIYDSYWKFTKPLNIIIYNISLKSLNQNWAIHQTKTLTSTSLWKIRAWHHCLNKKKTFKKMKFKSLIRFFLKSIRSCSLTHNLSTLTLTCVYYKKTKWKYLPWLWAVAPGVQVPLWAWTPTGHLLTEILPPAWSSHSLCSSDPDLLISAPHAKSSPFLYSADHFYILQHPLYCYKSKKKKRRDRYPVNIS